jgi:hypothetical protein
LVILVYDPLRNKGKREAPEKVFSHLQKQLLHGRKFIRRLCCQAQCADHQQRIQMKAEVDHWLGDGQLR